MQEWLTQSIRAMDWIDFWPVAAACALVAGRSFFRGLEYWRSSRLLEDVPRSRSRSAAQGYVQMVGEVQDHEMLPVSPLDSSRVAWWSHTVYSLPHSRTNMGGLAVAYLILVFFFERTGIERHEESRHRFRIRDEHGDCEVEPRGANVITSKETAFTGSMRREISAADRVAGMTDAKARWHFVGSEGSGNERHVYRWISPGERVYILGDFATLSGSEPESAHGYGSLRSRSEEVLAEWKQDGSQFLDRFDVDGDGTLDAREWTLIRRAAMTEARLRVSGRKRKRVVNRLRKPASGASFLIVSLDDPALGPALRRRAMAWLLAFFALGVLTVWAINLRMAGLGG